MGGMRHTHTHTDSSVASLESQNQQRHIQSRSHFTHTHTPQKMTNYFGNLWLCADISDDRKIKNTPVTTKLFAFFFPSCDLSITGFHRLLMIYTISVNPVLLTHCPELLPCLFRLPLPRPFPLSCSAPTTGGDCIHFHSCGGAGCKAVISDCGCEREKGGATGWQGMQYVTISLPCISPYCVG